MQTHTTVVMPLALSVDEACQASRLGRTRIYELINNGRLKSIKLGRRRLIHAESLYLLIQEGF